jgi:hypothetical protein
MAERGGFEPPAAQNDDGAKDFDVIDISKLKTVVAETGVSRKVPPSPAKTETFRLPKRGANGAEKGMRDPGTQRPFKGLQVLRPRPL